MRQRTIGSFARGTHYPKPYAAADATRCWVCLRRLTRYRTNGRPSFRHSPRDPVRPKPEPRPILGPVPCQGCRQPVVWNGLAWRRVDGLAHRHAA